MAIVRDDHVVKSMETRYLTYAPGESYIACQDVDFGWTMKKTLEFEKLWRKGKTLHEMSKHFRRPPVEILMIAVDRAMLGHIEEREGGLLGECLSKALGHTR
ncbi:hypothetical protein [Bacillus niameyensis]|uniref:hypothetical protein n=1 Tax=Bacillus niameyensis TaxID=1522308 RepID=UPI000784C585|nr:hypothetical protein [Bacillus niameyensis]